MEEIDPMRIAKKKESKREREREMIYTHQSFLGEGSSWKRKKVLYRETESLKRGDFLLWFFFFFANFVHGYGAIQLTRPVLFV